MTAPSSTYSSGQVCKVVEGTVRLGKLSQKGTPILIMFKEVGAPNLGVI